TPTHTPTNTPTVTPTDTPADTPTDTPTPQTLLVGHVTWQGRPAQPNPLQALPISLTLRLSGGGPDNEYTGLTTDASGFFTVNVGNLGRGIYDWRVKGPLFLANSGSLLVGPGATTNTEMGLMRTGDCDSSNVVNATDF